MTKRMARQGDLLFLPIDHLPEGIVFQADNVIVCGEAASHAHQLQAGRVFQNDQGTLFVEVLTATQVVHQEHRPITLEPGYYQVTRQREYRPEDPGMVVVE